MPPLTPIDALRQDKAAVNLIMKRLSPKGQKAAEKLINAINEQIQLLEKNKV